MTDANYILKTLDISWPFPLADYSGYQDIGYLIEITQFDDEKMNLDSYKPDEMTQEFNKLGVQILKPMIYKNNTNYVNKETFLEFLIKCIFVEFPQSVRSVMLFFHSHGNRLGLFTSDKNVVLFEDIMAALSSNTSLNGKLKWFFFACCHGPEVKINADTFIELTLNEMIPRMNTNLKSGIFGPRPDTIAIYSANLGQQSYTANLKKVLTKTCSDIEELHKNSNMHIFIEDFLNRLNCRFREDLDIQSSQKQLSEYTSVQTRQMILNRTITNLTTNPMDVSWLGGYTKLGDLQTKEEELNRIDKELNTNDKQKMEELKIAKKKIDQLIERVNNTTISTPQQK